MNVGFVRTPRKLQHAGPAVQARRGRGGDQLLAVRRPMRSRLEVKGCSAFAALRDPFQLHTGDVLAVSESSWGTGRP